MPLERKYFFSTLYIMHVYFNIRFSKIGFKAFSLGQRFLKFLRINNNSRNRKPEGACNGKSRSLKPLKRGSTQHQLITMLEH